MFYRVVMQGRTLGGADIEEVKKQFVRVTGLPMSVAEQMFGGMPQVVKRQLAQPDAWRCGHRRGQEAIRPRDRTADECR